MRLKKSRCYLPIPCFYSYLFQIYCDLRKLFRLIFPCFHLCDVIRHKGIRKIIIFIIILISSHIYFFAKSGCCECFNAWLNAKIILEPNIGNIISINLIVIFWSSIVFLQRKTQNRNPPLPLRGRSR